MLSLLLACNVAFAWGPTGHRAVGLIAQRHVSPATLAEIRALMGTESLARASTWPDEIRSDPAWQDSDPDAWRRHFINAPRGEALPLGDPNVQTEADQVLSGPRDIFVALHHYKQVVADRSVGDEQRRVALRWLVHLAGDAHQPLHTGSGADRGGNSVTVAWFDEKTNLHTVWDERLIEHTQLSYTELVDFIDHAAPSQISQWQGAPISGWLTESRALLPAAYDTGDGWLSWDYAWRHTPVVEQRLLQAGVRLAGVLDEAFEGDDMRRKRRRRR